MIFCRFDLYFRKNPFGGEYTIFAGLEECIKLIANFRLTEDEIDFIRQSLPASCEVTNLFIGGNDILFFIYETAVILAYLILDHMKIPIMIIDTWRPVLL